MSTPIKLTTTQEGLVLRQLATDADDIAYFEAVEANREHLSQFGDKTSQNYPDLESVRQARINPSNPDKLRLGIWLPETFVGSINLTPDGYGNAEVGYWLDNSYTGHGYATLAVGALAKYARRRYDLVYANVAQENLDSAAVLERAGFEQLAKAAGQLTFALKGFPRTPKAIISKDEEAAVPPVEKEVDKNLELYGNHPTRREALRATDKDGLVVYIAFITGRKLYRCYYCQDNIDIGDPHAVMSRVKVQDKSDKDGRHRKHHHIDFKCVQNELLPTLKNIKIIDPNAASRSAMNARRRKNRYRKRRQ